MPVLEAMQNKYRMSDEHYEDFYTKIVHPKLVDFIGDERKRDCKKKRLVSASTTSSNTCLSNPDHSS